jgi:putative aldouronate transport system permease protein
MSKIPGGLLSFYNNKRFSGIFHSVVRHRGYYLVLLPILVYFFIFRYVPIYGIIIAFKNFIISKGILDSPWMQPLWGHFQRAFKSQVFLRTLKNTFIISFYKSILAFPVPIVFAILLDELPGVKYKKIIQTISYIPHFISWVILGGILRNLLSPSTGAFNYIIVRLGGEAKFFLGDPVYFRSIVLISHIWQSVGYGAIVYLAAIAGIDQEQYESARIDGASRFGLIWNITLPSIISVVFIMFILQIGHLLDAGFDQIFNLYNPSTYATGDIIDTYVYRTGLLDQQYSFSTAVGLFKNLIGLALVLVSNAMVRRLDDEAGIF